MTEHRTHLSGLCPQVEVGSRKFDVDRSVGRERGSNSVSEAGADFTNGDARRDIASLELVGEVENLTGRLVSADRFADALCVKAGVSKSNHSFVTPLCVFQKDVCVYYVVWFPAFWTARIPAPPANVDISMSPPQ